MEPKGYDTKLVLGVRVDDVQGVTVASGVVDDNVQFTKCSPGGRLVPRTVLTTV